MQPPPGTPRTGSFVIPPLACDCHMHVFGPIERYPPAAKRSYTPRDAPLEAWRTTVGAFGLRRLVLVQPSAYGADNRCLLDALGQVGENGRGIAQIDASTSDADLARMNQAGVRGVRLNPRSAGDRDPGPLRALIQATAERIHPLGWHIQLHAELGVVSALVAVISTSPVPVVMDHMAGARASDTMERLQPILRLLETGRCWVKLSGAYRVSSQPNGFIDATPTARALVQANPDHVVWGSDWPHTAPHQGRTSAEPPVIDFRPLDEAALLDRLADAVDDQNGFTGIMSANPARLYGFGEDAVHSERA